MNKQLTTTDKALTRYQHIRLALESIRLDPKLADSTKYKYKQALRGYVATGHALADDRQLAKYSLSVSDSTRSFLKATIGKLSKHLRNELKSGRIIGDLEQLTKAIWKTEVLTDSIQLSNKKGESFHTWLTPKELTKLLGMTRTNGLPLVEVRDRIALGLMSNGCLRRSEVVSLEFSDLKEREGFYILEITGKGNKQREVKLSASLAADILSMGEMIGAGKIIRAMLKRKNQPKGYTLIGDYWVGQGITAHALYNLVLRYGKLIKKDIQPHDLRRSGSRIAFKAGITIEQISLSLGHESIETTSLYLGIEREWEVQPSDVIPY